MTTEHDVEVSLRWADMDANRHVNNVEFFRLFEEARARWFMTAGDRSQFLDQGIVVVSQHLDYLRALAYRQESVRVGLSVTAVARSSFTLGCRIYDPVECTGDLVYATGSVVIVAFDDETGRARRLDPEELQWLKAAGGEV